ncbi:histidine phosphatase family protein [bacterium]|nr:histidine phosphatase family protein [bacterium]
MKDVVVWLVRHGETVWNAEHKISGWVDVELSQRGQQMARDLRAKLEREHFDGVWSSDLKRAMDTAELAYRRPEKVDARLRELDFGPLEGLNWMTMPPEHKREVQDFCENCTRGGETISSFEQRVCSFLDHLQPGRHLLFVHAGVIRVALRRVRADRFVPPTSVAIVNWSREQLIELHLPPEIGA